MKIKSHTLGFPRIGLKRELKIAQEKYWAGKISDVELFSVGKMLRKRHWMEQKKLGVDFLPVGDFSWYDHVLDTTMMLGNIPDRHKNDDDSITLDTLFRIARGIASTGDPVCASDMTKWFNTNYHYIVPEFKINTQFNFSWKQILDEVDEAILLKFKIKPVILGPLTYLWLGKVKGLFFNKLDLLKDIIPIYCYLLTELKKRNIAWVQIDEPILALELSEEWKNSFHYAYNSLFNGYNKLLLTTYFGSIEHNLSFISQLPIQGLHLDLISGCYDLFFLNNQLPKEWLISLGIINGRNIWKADLVFWFNKLLKFIEQRQHIWIGTSCSLLHTPIDVSNEKKINLDIKNWLAFSLQKCKELSLLSDALNNQFLTEEIKIWSSSLQHKSNSKLIHNLAVKNRITSLPMIDIQRKSKFSIRMRKQREYLHLPILPTTTIGSFPQTNDVRKLRLNFKEKKISLQQYNLEIFNYIKEVIEKQEKLGLDVLVHGEFERNDMVEYFGEHLEGFVFTENGWVQSYGSRCVKPPIIVGDIFRSQSISIDYIKYAQSLTNKPVKGMLTGPVTILCWSFVREDLSRDIIARQIALALNDEVLELEKVGINIIQIDEPALREGLPLRRSLWNEYLSWAIEVFKLSCIGIRDETQIHTHMCYCEFNDIMHAITLLDADVITIETSRSDMELLEFFKNFSYPNQIGPGVYDIHSPNVPSIDWIIKLLNKAKNYIPIERLWVNPDCGLKTRTWKETEKALQNMVKATKIFRKLYI